MKYYSTTKCPHTINIIMISSLEQLNLVLFFWAIQKCGLNSVIHQSFLYNIFHFPNNDTNNLLSHFNLFSLFSYLLLLSQFLLHHLLLLTKNLPISVTIILTSFDNDSRNLSFANNLWSVHPTMKPKPKFQRASSPSNRPQTSKPKKPEDYEFENEEVAKDYRKMWDKMRMMEALLAQQGIANPDEEDGDDEWMNDDE